MTKAKRYCVYCHGENLVGGSDGQPSCFRCHGETWLAVDSEMSFAPSDHTENRGGYNHHPQFLTPLDVCTACHGAELEGNGSDDTPSCFLCHGQKWQ